MRVQAGDGVPESDEPFAETGLPYGAVMASAGASMLVIGRPITQADDPMEAYEAVVSELCEA